jgi:hypothetical protein
MHREGRTGEYNLNSVEWAGLFGEPNGVSGQKEKKVEKRI